MPHLIALLGAAAIVAGAPFAGGLQTIPARAPAVAPAAKPAAAAQLTAAERSTILKAASKALSSVKTARGRFEQVAPDQTLSQGQFAMSRPGKVRFDYDDPVPLLLVSDGATVALQDSELETTDRVPLSTTPLGLLLSSTLNLEKDAEIVDVRKGGGRVTISLRDTDDEMDGTLTIFLADQDYSLIGWRTLEGNGDVTSVQLSKIEYGKKLNPRLFVLRDLDNR